MRSALTATAPLDAMVPLASEGSGEFPLRDDEPKPPRKTRLPSGLAANEPVETMKFEDCEAPVPSIPTATWSVRALGVGFSAVPSGR
jgi:hypothetical protein